MTDETRGLKPPRDYFLETERGNVIGVGHLHVNGYNDDIGNAVEKLVVGGVFDIPTAVVTTIDVYSSSVEDAPSPKTGAFTIRISYLDADFAEQTKDITMNGTTKVTWTSADFFRFQHACVLTTGTANNNVGNIEITNADQSKRYGYIAATANESASGLYTVPAGKTAYLKGAWFSGGDYADKVQMHFWAECDSWSHVKAANQFYRFHEVSLDGNPGWVDFHWIRIPEKATVYITVVAGTGAEVATCRVTGLLYESVE
jgi:hypothetical protein